MKDGKVKKIYGTRCTYRWFYIRSNDSIGLSNRWEIKISFSFELRGEIENNRKLEWTNKILSEAEPFPNSFSSSNENKKLILGSRWNLFIDDRQRLKTTANCRTYQCSVQSFFVFVFKKENKSETSESLERFLFVQFNSSLWLESIRNLIKNLIQNYDGDSTRKKCNFTIRISFSNLSYDGVPI